MFKSINVEVKVQIHAELLFWYLKNNLHSQPSIPP
jgi:hypothetical protein